MKLIADSVKGIDSREFKTKEPSEIVGKTIQGELVFF